MLTFRRLLYVPDGFFSGKLQVSEIQFPQNQFVGVYTYTRKDHHVYLIWPLAWERQQTLMYMSLYWQKLVSEDALGVVCCNTQLPELFFKFLGSIFQALIPVIPFFDLK